MTRIDRFEFVEIYMNAFRRRKPPSLDVLSILSQQYLALQPTKRWASTALQPRVIQPETLYPILPRLEASTSRPPVAKLIESFEECVRSKKLDDATEVLMELPLENWHRLATDSLYDFLLRSAARKELDSTAIRLLSSKLPHFLRHCTEKKTLHAAALASSGSR